MPENTTPTDFTPYLNKIKLPSGIEYWFQDAWAQERLDSLGDIVVGGNGVHFKGETTSQLTDEITTNPIVIGGQNYTPTTGDLVIYAKKEFVWSGSKWLELGDLSSFGTLATKDTAVGSISVPTVTSATFSGIEGPITISTVSSTGGNYQPSGSVSKPSFTGTAATINVNGTPNGSVSQPSFTGTTATVNVSGTPNGSVSKPNFTGTTATINVSGTPNGSVSAPAISVKTAGPTTTVNSITSVGSLPSLTMLLDGDNSHMLVVSWDAGALPSKGNDITVKTGDAAYQATVPTFTGSATTFSGSYQPAGSVSKPDFTGSTTTFSGSYQPTGSVSKPDFTGSTSTFSGSYTPSGSVGQPTFTGTTVQISGTATPSGTINIGTGTSNINVTVS